MADALPPLSPPKPRRPLFRKYFTLLSLLVTGSLGLHGIVEMYFGYWENREALMQGQKQKAGAAALQIEAFMQDIVQAMDLMTAQAPEIQLEGVTPRFRRSLFALLRNRPAIMEATVIDRNGRQSLRHSRLRPILAEDRQNYSAVRLFSTAMSGETYFSPVYFYLGSEPFLTVAVPITSLEGPRLGVLTAEVNLKHIREVISEIGVGEAGFAYVVERGGDLIAHPDLALVLQKTNLKALPQVRDFMNARLAPNPAPRPRSVLGRNASGERVLSSYAAIAQLGWGVFVEQPLREAFDPLYSSLLRMGVILLAVLFLALLTSFTLTQAIVRPIERLRRAVSRIGQGHLTEQIAVQTSDEIGDLAAAFNEMAGTLLASRQELEGHSRSLEQRVSERTRDLSTLLATARQAVASLNLDEILPVVLRSATELLHCHSGTIHLLDPQTGILRLAADSTLNEEFHHRGDIALGEGRMGRVAQEGRPTVVEDVETDSLYRNAEGALRAGIRSMAMVPLQGREAIIGVLAVHDSKRRRFSQDEISALTQFADLAALAIEKVRLHEEATRQRREAEILAEIARDLSSSLDLETLLRKIIGYARELCGSDLAFIAPYDPAEGAATIVAYVGTRTDAFRGLKVLPGKGIGGKVLETRQPCITEDYLRDPRWAHDYNPLAKEEGFAANLAVPVMREEELLGVLWVVNRAPRPFTTPAQTVLAKLANQAAIAIQNARLYQGLEEHSRNLEERVRERTQELEITSRHKSEFLATMSHELRTPLNAIIGFSELLRNQLGSSLSDRHRRFVDNVQMSGRHLLNLINAILDLAKVESGKMDLHWEEIPLPELLQQVIAGIQPQAVASALTLSWQVEEGLGRVTLDAGKLKQILYNLVGNAVKFTPDGGQVRVAARVVRGSGQQNFLEVSVTDTGIGIKPEDLGRIFEPFQQIDSSLARKYPGAGLGLGLTRKLVELHGGQIKVESSPGHGSTFTFTLALPSPAVPAPKSVEIPPEKPEMAAEGEDHEGGTDRPLILVVEDDPKAIDLLSTYLRDGGYRVVVAGSTEETLTKARALRPQAITLDITFPTEDGWLILQNLKKDSGTRGIPVLIVSIVDDRPRGLQLGAVEHLVKPVTQEAVLAGLARAGISPPALERVQILAIDDDPSVLDLMSATLEGQPLSLLTAHDGPEGIRLARTKKPDLIILDLMMPGMTGFEVVQHLRADPATAEIPIFICTAKTVTEEERELLARHVEWITQKGSLRPQDLLQMIAEVRNRLRPAP